MNVSRDEVGPVNILLVDDRPHNLTSLEASLRRPDYSLVTATSGREALALVLRQEFAVILLDVAMPEMDGFETATIIREREQTEGIPIIFVTASVYDMKHVFRGYTDGPVDYLRKPIDVHQVRGKVALFVELFRQRKRLEAMAERIRELERALEEGVRPSADDGEAVPRSVGDPG